MEYRSQIKPKYTRWIRDGMQRLKDHQAMKASLELAQKALEFSYQPIPGETRVEAWRIIDAQMAQLRANGVTPEALFGRVAELVAYLKDNPQACSTRREEDFAIARAVLHIIRWQGVGRGQGASMLAAVGSHLREWVVQAAMAFVRRLDKDQQREGELMRQAVSFD